MNPNYTEINAEEQMGREDSVFAFYKEMIALRKNETYKECIVYGEQVPVFTELHNVMAFYRKGEDKTLLVIGNYQNEERELELSEEVKNVVVNNYKEAEINGKNLKMKGYQFLVLEV